MITTTMATKPATNIFATIGTTSFKTALQIALTSLDSGSTRYNLGAVCVDVDGYAARVVGTNGRSLSVSTIDMRDCVPRGKILIPERDARAIANGITTLSSPLLLQTDGHETEPTIVATWLAGRQREQRSHTWQVKFNRFPDWRCVMPNVDYATTTTVRATTERMRMLFGALRTTATFEFKPGAANTAVRFQSRRKFPEIETTGAPFDVDLDCELVHPWLQRFDDKEWIAMHCWSKDSAVMFTANGQHELVVMPCRQD